MVFTVTFLHVSPPLARQTMSDDEEEEEEEEGESDDLDEYMKRSQDGGFISNLTNSFMSAIGGAILRHFPAVRGAIPSGHSECDSDDDDFYPSGEVNWKDEIGTGGIEYPEWTDIEDIGYRDKQYNVTTYLLYDQFNFVLKGGMDEIYAGDDEEEEEEEDEGEEARLPKIGKYRLGMLVKLRTLRWFESSTDTKDMHVCLLSSRINGILARNIDSAVLAFEFWSVVGPRLMHRREVQIRGGLCQERAGTVIFSHDQLPPGQRVPISVLNGALGKEKVLEKLVEQFPVPRVQRLDKWHFSDHGNKQFHKQSFLSHWVFMNQTDVFPDGITKLPMYRVKGDDNAVCFPRVAWRQLATAMQQRVFSRLPYVSPASVSVRVSRIRLKKQGSSSSDVMAEPAISFSLDHEICRIPREVPAEEFPTMIEPVVEKSE